MLFKSKVSILGEGGRRAGFLIEGSGFFPADGRGGAGVTVGDGGMVKNSIFAIAKFKIQNKSYVLRPTVLRHFLLICQVSHFTTQRFNIQNS